MLYQPIGNSNMLQQMNDIREMQDKLTLKHFEIDQMRISKETSGSTSGAAVEESSDASLMELTKALEKLGSAIQSLHSADSLKRPDSHMRTGKKVQVRTDQEDLV